MTNKLRVAIVHYHLRPGGVTRVIGNAVAALADEGVDSAVIVGNVPPDNTISLEKVRIVDELSYDQGIAQAAPKIPVDEMMEAAVSVLGAPPDVWHFHNHTLGKNLIMPQVVCRLAEQGHHVVLQIHDFAEDGRPENFHLLLQGLAGGDMDTLGARLYPQSPHVHYATLNRRDRDYLAYAGVPKERLHLLPNAIWMWQGTSHEYEHVAAPDERLFLYPTRAIRRKNLGEFVLWAAVTDDGARFATTLAPENPVALEFHDKWVALAEELDLPIQFAMGSASRTHFSDLVRSSYALVTTSVAEGFGLAFLEPWLVGRPVIGRNLPELTEDFEEAGVHLEHLYPHLEVPLEWIGEEVLRDRIAQGLKPYLEAYGREMTSEDVDRAVIGAMGEKGVDFGRLDEDLQATVIRKVVESPALRTELVPSALTPAEYLAAQMEHNRQAVLREFGIAQYGKRLAQLYEKCLSHEPGTLEPLSAGRLLDKFLNPERFTLLRT